MSYEKLSPANFHAHLAKGNIGGCDLRPIDQCAHAIIQERKDKCRLEQQGRASGSGINSAFDYADWEKTRNVMQRFSKRLDRGGMTRRPEDSLLRSPRGKYPLSMDDL